MTAMTNSSNHLCSDWQNEFLALLPSIEKQAGRALRYLRDQARTEAIQDVVCNAMLAYIRLLERGQLERVFPSVLVRFAIAQYRAGRRAGQKLNCRDVLSPYAHCRSGIGLQSLTSRSPDGEAWHDVLVETKYAGPAETAAARIDVADWFAALPRRDRRMAKTLSQGCSTGDAATRYGVSPGRISQKRREFHRSWEKFQTD